MFQTVGRQIANEDLSAEGGLATKLLRNITDREVDRVRTLVSEQRELGLVRRDDYRNDRGTWTLSFKLSLETEHDETWSKETEVS